MSLLFLVAGTLGLSSTLAATVVSVILTGSTIITIIIALAGLVGGGLDVILTMGWTAFVAEVKQKVAEKGMAMAIGW